jgi:hypothetical protein
MSCYVVSTHLYEKKSNFNFDFVSVESTSRSFLPTDPSLSTLGLFNGDDHDSMNNFNVTLIGNLSFITGYVGQAIALYKLIIVIYYYLTWILSVAELFLANFFILR